ncbi:MAG: hypothetical protein GF344_04490 [Chitinivibrionales bacterium]|nr:hypothetical protein [Chitinivibrionales bacterium]MBD3356301.1 hypothetical protein [Chitinivibrionales bacterium]
MTDVKVVTFVALSIFLPGSCFAPRLNPLDPENPNTATSFSVKVRHDFAGTDTLSDVDTFSLEVFSAEHDVALTIWEFDTCGDGSIDVVDTLFASSRIYMAPWGRTREIKVNATVVGEAGARGRDSITILPRWRPFDTLAGIDAGEVSALAVDSNNIPWVGFMGGVLARYDGRTWEKNSAPVARPGKVSAILVNEDNSKWIGINAGESGVNANGGLWLLSVDNRWMLNTSDIRYISGLGRENRERLWLLAHDRGVFSLEVGGGSIDTIKFDTLFWEADLLDTIPTTAINVGTSPDGDVWLGTQSRGLFYRSDKGIWHNYSSAGSIDAAGNALDFELPADRVDALAVAPDNSVWISSGGALIHYHPDHGVLDVTVQGQKFLNKPDKIRSIAFSPSGEIWVGMWSGLACIDPDGTWQKFTTDNSGLPHNSVENITLDRQNNVWLMTGKGGVVRYHRYNKL